MTWITDTIATIDLDAYQRDYYDPTQKAADVALKYNIPPSVQDKVIRALEWPTRKQVKCFYVRGSNPAPKNGNGNITPIPSAVKQVYGCNRHCQYWSHCTAHGPTSLPCELFVFDDELIDSDPDSAIYYRSSLEVRIYVE